MKPLPKGRPLLWNAAFISMELEVPRGELARRLGAPHIVFGEGNGLGPEEAWCLVCDCGLEVMVRHLRVTGSLALVSMQHLEVEHVLAHLGLEGDAVVWRVDAGAPMPADGWAVVRQDDAGNRYDICVMPVRAHAECYARLMEARAHKQSYDVGLRGTPSRWVPPRPARGWAVIRQDELGNREELIVVFTEKLARKLAEGFEAQPRHKQAYFVEPLTPES